VIYNGFNFWNYRQMWRNLQM